MGNYCGYHYRDPRGKVSHKLKGKHDLMVRERREKRVWVDHLSLSAAATC